MPVSYARFESTTYPLPTLVIPNQRRRRVFPTRVPPPGPLISTICLIWRFARPSCAPLLPFSDSPVMWKEAFALSPAADAGRLPTVNSLLPPLSPQMQALAP